VSRRYSRAKLSKARPGTDGEAEAEETDRIDLFTVGETGKGTDQDINATMPSTPIVDGMRLEEWMEPNLLESLGVCPSFKTYNAALRYTLELKLVISAGGAATGKNNRNVLIFRRNVEVLPSTFKPATQAVAREGEELLWMTQRGLSDEEVDAPPAYCDPPPEYMSAALMESPRAMISV